MITLALSIVLFLPNVVGIAQILPFELPYIADYFVSKRMGTEAILLMLCLMQITYPLITFLSNFKENMKKLINYLLGLLKKTK